MKMSCPFAEEKTVIYLHERLLYTTAGAERKFGISGNRTAKAENLLLASNIPA